MQQACPIVVVVGHIVSLLPTSTICVRLCSETICDGVVNSNKILHSSCCLGPLEEGAGEETPS